MEAEQWHLGIISGRNESLQVFMCMLNIFAHMIMHQLIRSTRLKQPLTTHPVEVLLPILLIKCVDTTYQLWSRTVQRLIGYGHINYQAASTMKCNDMHNKVHLNHSVLIIHHAIERRV